MFYRSNKLVQFTGRIYGSRLWFVSYMVKSYVDIAGRVFGSSLRSNLQVDCSGLLYVTSLQSTLLDRFTERVYGLSSRAEFTVQVYGTSLLVMFTGLVYWLSFVLTFRAEFTNPVFESCLTGQIG